MAKDVISDTRYIFGFKEPIVRSPFLRRIGEWILSKLGWTVRWETKYFYPSGGDFIGFSEVYCAKCGHNFLYHRGDMDWFFKDMGIEPHAFEDHINIDTMGMYPNGWGRLEPSGHIHHGKKELYPFEEGREPIIKIEVSEG